MIITHADNGKTFDVALGERVVVRLDESPTTGYRWRSDIDGDAITLSSTEFLPERKGAIGGGGQVSFTFSADKAGRAILRFKLWKEWEGDSSTVDRVAIDINVKIP